MRNRKICEACGKVLDLTQIGRGYELDDGSLVAITDEELDALPLESVRAIEVQGFNPYESVDLLRVGKPYYLAPNGHIAARPCALIVQALQRNSKVAITKFALRDRERYGLLRVKDGVLVLHQLLASDEIRSPAALAPRETDVPADELQRALDQTDALTTEDLGDLTDHYKEALEEVITAKIEDRHLSRAEAPAPREPVLVDLMAALNESVAAARRSRGESGEHATVHEMPQPKGTAKKTATDGSVKARRHDDELA
ncbi:Ku protein [Streptomyces sp. NBC_00885]|uniref:non-homologous end joining protein Ku n=1 Tax=Streptomyces sp. NBC_00885 TaxID=2975857 RepID=UPI00386B16C0|nr:Ku protein [Streptomyces sp. NBC_00885]WSY72609.1 Ku protein [Streptomyces sp. NBC_00885]